MNNPIQEGNAQPSKKKRALMTVRQPSNADIAKTLASLKTTIKMAGLANAATLAESNRPKGLAAELKKDQVTDPASIRSDELQFQKGAAAGREEMIKAMKASNLFGSTVPQLYNKYAAKDKILMDTLQNMRKQGDAFYNVPYKELEEVLGVPDGNALKEEARDQYFQNLQVLNTAKFGSYPKYNDAFILAEALAKAEGVPISSSHIREILALDDFSFPSIFSKIIGVLGDKISSISKYIPSPDKIIDVVSKLVSDNNDNQTNVIRQEFDDKFNRFLDTTQHLFTDLQSKLDNGKAELQDTTEPYQVKGERQKYANKTQESLANNAHPSKTWDLDVNMGYIQTFYSPENYTVRRPEEFIDKTAILNVVTTFNISSNNAGLAQLFLYTNRTLYAGALYNSNAFNGSTDLGAQTLISSSIGTSSTLINRLKCVAASVQVFGLLNQNQSAAIDLAYFRTSIPSTPITLAQMVEAQIVVSGNAYTTYRMIRPLSPTTMEDSGGTTYPDFIVLNVSGAPASANICRVTFTQILEVMPTAAGAAILTQAYPEKGSQTLAMISDLSSMYPSLTTLSLNEARQLALGLGALTNCSRQEIYNFIGKIASSTLPQPRLGYVSALPQINANEDSDMSEI
jgi:hypothetical protein